jgi:hypothetical protein
MAWQLQKHNVLGFARDTVNHIQQAYQVIQLTSRSISDTPAFLGSSVIFLLVLLLLQEDHGKELNRIVLK